MSIRVLRASPRVLPHLGGQEIHIDQLTRHLATFGLDQLLVYATGKPENAGVRTIRIGVPSLRSNIARDAAFGWRIAGRPIEPIDIVHTHGDTPVARGGAIAAARSDAIHVHTFHGSIVPKGIRALVSRAFLPRGSWYLAVSRSVARGVAEAGADAERIRVRSSGVREEFFRVDAPRTEDVAIGGRLIPEKRIADFVARWADTETGVSRLKVFGAGPDSARIVAIAQGASNIDWLGELAAEQLSGLLGSVAVGVVSGRAVESTRSNEGTPTLALEMIASGCYPVIGATTGDVVPMVGRLAFGEVDENLPDPERLVSLAREWAGPDRETSRREARRAIEATSSWPVVAAQIHAFYQEILEARR